ncbi:50S ribosomal protein L2 [Patescibacteria group bacterium]|nr:50S ribosomal protein L2 [Patescibacteria group bacterium]MBU0963781.1 50S ribosomal protein L2 [Patescibacteria group bacterium]
MAVKVHKPTTPGRRKSSVVDTSVLSKVKPYKKLLNIKKSTAGRNSRGKITVRHRGGGHKRFYRVVDNQRTKYDKPAEVVTLEYDPNRTAWIALIKYEDEEKQYIIMPEDLKVGDTVVASKEKAEIKPGNRLPLTKIPLGITVHDIELQPGSKGTMVRAAGSGAIVQSQEGNYAQLKLPSGEIRLFNKNCMASIGQVSNVDHENTRIGKAGRNRWLGKRPTVRGKAMNPVDHPHGGGEGSNPIGLKHPKTPWGKPALGVKTRKKGKYSDKFIITKRK